MKESTMKNIRQLFLIMILLLMSCESNSNDNENEVIELTEISNEVAEELDDNLDAVESEMMNDFDESFSLFDESNSKTNDRSYDENTGYWTINRDLDFTRTVTRYRDNKTITRTDAVDFEVEILTRFNDDSGNAIQFPKSNPDTVKTILIERSSDLSIETDVSVSTDEGVIDSYKSKNRDKTVSQNVTMTKTDIEHVWDMTFSASKSLELEITRNDSVQSLNATMTVTTSDLRIIKVRQNLLRLKTRIISGEIKRVITLSNGTVINVVTTYYDCEADNNTEKIKYMREFFKNDASTAYKSVTVYCRNTSR